MLVFLLMLQYAVKAHAHRVAEAAAEEALGRRLGVRRLALPPAEQAGNHTLSDLGSLSNTTVVVTRSGTTASATVTGDVEQLIPFLPVHVTVRIEGPVEQFVESP